MNSLYNALDVDEITANKYKLNLDAIVSKFKKQSEYY